MSAGITAAEAVDTPRGQRIRTNRSETVRRYLEWHGFHAAEIHGGIVTYQRENASSIEAAPMPAEPGVIPVY